MSEQRVAQLEEDKKHIEFMASMKKYDADVQEGGEGVQQEEKKEKQEDPAMDLFPDDENEDRSSEWQGLFGECTREVLHHFTFLSEAGNIITKNLSSLFMHPRPPGRHIGIYS